MDINNLLTRGVEEILPTKKALEDLMGKRKITLFQGFDPTAPSLHIGHFIGLRKLAQFQKLGHKVIFLVGDFTGLIGDPTDKNAARVKQTREEVLSNLKEYKNQAAKIIDFDGPNKAQIVFNSDWLSKLTFEEVVNLSSSFTVQQMIERDMFQARLKENKPIYLHEFLYPLMQGYDSVAMIPEGIDMEIGGSDQLFNMLAGRTLMKALKNKEKFVLSMKLLTDKDGKKMSKTDGNAIFLSDPPNLIYAKIMSWPDSFITPAVELLSDLSLDLLKEVGPLSAKKMLAYEVVKQTHGEEDAAKAQNDFIKTFSEKAPEFDIKVNSGLTLAVTIAPFTPKNSVSDAKRFIKQNAVEIDGIVINESSHIVLPGDKIKVGKKIYLIAK